MPVKTVKRYDYLPGQLIMKLKEDAVQPHLSGRSFAMTGRSANRLPSEVAAPLEYLQRNAGLQSVVPMFSKRESALRRARTSVANLSKLAIMTSVADSESEELRGINMVQADPEQMTPALLKKLRAGKAVDFVERMPARWAMHNNGAPDPKLNLQWGLRAIGWFDAQIPAAEQITVGVLDSGIDTSHPDLTNVPTEYFHQGLKKEDIIGHGTHVAGIIAAAVNNGVGIAGVAACRLAVWKVFPDEPAPDGEFYVDMTRYLRALRQVQDSDARIVNLSIGGTKSSRVEALLFGRLHRAGVFVAAAMGNEYQFGNPTSYPAAYEGVTAVGAVGADLRRGVFSNTGKHIKIAAPGVAILSTLPVKRSKYRNETKYASWDGTSMATPHVAGVAALLQARHPGLPAQEIEERLVEASRPLAAMSGQKFTPEYGHGLLHLRRLL